VNCRAIFGCPYGTKHCGKHLKDRKKEIGPGLLNAMLNQLGISRDDFF
jgi:hypothetical protein